MDINETELKSLSLCLLPRSCPRVCQVCPCFSPCLFYLQSLCQSLRVHLSMILPVVFC